MNVPAAGTGHHLVAGRDLDLATGADDRRFLRTGDADGRERRCHTHVLGSTQLSDLSGPAPTGPAPRDLAPATLNDIIHELISLSINKPMRIV